MYIVIYIYANYLNAQGAMYALFVKCSTSKCIGWEWCMYVWMHGYFDVFSHTTELSWMQIGGGCYHMVP